MVAALHRIELCADMGAFVDHVFADISRARQRVAVQCFIVRDDNLGNALSEHLTAAAARGVSTRLIYDPLGSRETAPRFFQRLRNRGVKVRSYGTAAFALPGGRPRARNHGRLVVIDGAGYTGGHAWGDEWLPAKRGGRGWHDVCCRIEGPAVDDMFAVFEMRWREAPGGRSIADFDTGQAYPELRIASDTPGGRRLVFEEHLAMFRRARRRIWIENAYFFPPRPFLEALFSAAARGVDVKVIAPGRTDLPIVRWAARADYHDWQRRGLHILEYGPSVLHSKFALVDEDWCTVGSFNALCTSLALAIEFSVYIRDPEVVAELERLFQADVARSVAAAESGKTFRGSLERIRDGAAHALVSCADRLLCSRWGRRVLAPRGA